MDGQNEIHAPLLVFAVAGRLGSGASFVVDNLIHTLASFDYEVELIDVTDVILEYCDQYIKPEHEGEVGQAIPADADLDLKVSSNAAKRIRKYQLRGDRLRKKFGTSIVAQLCISEIIHRHINDKQVLASGKRQAYIIDSLKHPDEVLLLRSVFREALWTIGVVASDGVRRSRLIQRKGFTETEVDYLSELDAKEIEKSGQQAVDAITKADYFFVNNFSQKAEILPEVQRLLNIIFGIGIQSPKRDEVGMHAAYEAAARSACLSRQVGAAIFTSDGDALALGFNDVPQSGGGLYEPDSGQPDKRCWAFGAKCYSDEERKIIMNQIIAALESAGAFEGIDNEKRKKIEQAVFESRIKDIIEFTRAVHAETDAIISVARSGKPGLVGSTLYCNTFPCHNCTKHIIDAGVSRVVYLDPYEKSLARKLHGDAMLDTQHGASGGGGGGVVFDMYGGLSPSRYGDYFPELKDRKRKDSKTTKFVDLDRKRTTIDPIGAQEKDVLEIRINRVVKVITKIATRIKIGGQNSADVPAKQAKGKSEAKA